MKNIFLFMLLALVRSPAFAAESQKIPVNFLLKDTISYTLSCNLLYKKNRVRKRDVFECQTQNIRKAAVQHATQNGGTFLSYEIMSAPEGFDEGYYSKNNKLNILVNYVK